jgi:uncharacterized membrane protein (DUF106 family)
MAVNAIASVTAAYVQKASGGSQGSAQSAAVQEATETAAVTMKEAARGDMQAVRKLAKQQMQAVAMNPAPPASARTAVNVLA